MRRLRLLLAKELLGMHRSFRLWIALVVFLLVGLLSPLAASLMPQLLASLPEDQLRGVEILLTREPDLLDALGQYHKNMTMTPLLLALLAMGAVPSELQGTAATLLGAGAGRARMLLAKLLAWLLVATLGTALAAAGFLIYASVLFSTPDLPGFLALNGVYLLLLLLVIALTLLGGVLGRGQAAAAAMGLGGFLGLSALAILPSFARWTPAGLLELAGALIQGEICEPVVPVISALGLAGLCLGLAIARFRRMEL